MLNAHELAYSISSPPNQDLPMVFGVDLMDMILGY